MKMKYTIDMMVDIILYFYGPGSKDYEGWQENEGCQSFEEDGYAQKKDDKIELTDVGKLFLHDYIEQETKRIIEFVRKNGKNIYFTDIINNFRYGKDEEDSKEFIKYLIKNEINKPGSRIESFEEIISTKFGRDYQIIIK